MVSFIARTAVAVMFFAAAASKIRSRATLGFSDSLTRFHIGRRFQRPIAVAVIATEGVLSVLLLIPDYDRAASAVAAIILTAFTVMLYERYRSGDRAPCLCFGSSRLAIGWPSFARNGCAIGCALVGILGGGTPAAPTTAVAGIAGVALGLLLIFGDEMATALAVPQNRNASQ